MTRFALPLRALVREKIPALRASPTGGEGGGAVMLTYTAGTATEHEEKRDEARERVGRRVEYFYSEVLPACPR